MNGSLFIPSQYLMDNVISLLTQLSDSQVSLFLRKGAGAGGQAKKESMKREWRNRK